MQIAQPHDWTEVKKVKFHHKVKRFYYKNLFRKIYTVAIIGLIGANVFSLLKYQTFAEGGIQYTPADSSGYGTIIIPNPNNPSEGFTILDRNLGATATGAGSSASSDSYGYYYQWGNNNGNPGDSEVSTMLLPWDSSYSHNGYNGENNGFITNYNSYYDIWSDEELHDDLWGGENDYYENYRGYELDNYTDRQGPCPEKYHVPSVGEWSKIIEYRCGNNPDKCSLDNIGGDDELHYNLTDTNVGIYFAQDLYIPFAGGRYNYDGSVDAGYYAILWSSSPSVNGDHRASLLGLDDDGMWADDGDIGRADGLSVRCVSDSHQLVTGPFSLTLNANGGEVAEDTIETDDEGKVILPTASRDADSNGERIFEGWFADEGISEKIGNPGDEITLTADKELYAHWVQTITIPNPNNPSEGFTILDRNLGATATGAGSSASSDSYGLYYQWGNNNGNPGDSATDATLLTWESDGRYSHKGYNGENNGFIRVCDGSWNWQSQYDIWSDEEIHDDLWGGENDTSSNYRGYELDNYTDRQGPCPADYHVPSAGEWSKIIEYRCGNNPEKCTLDNIGGDDELHYNEDDSNVGMYFAQDLYIPFAGDRVYDDGSVYAGDYISLWSSSPNGYGSYYARSFYLDGDEVSVGYRSIRAAGFPVRCVSDSHQLVTGPFSITFVSNGGSDVDAQEVPGNATGSRPDDPERTGYSFGGRYEAENFEGEEFDFEVTPITADITLYAKWTINKHKLSFVVDGNEIQSGDVAYSSGISAFIPSEPKKDCNSFAGWTSSVDGLTVTGTMPDSDVVFTATWNYICSSSGGGGGGGRSSSSNGKSKTNSGSETHGSAEDENVVQSEIKGSEESNSKNETQMDSSSQAPQNDDSQAELVLAYQFAYKNGITTRKDIKSADMNGKLTRIQMAKMLSQYAVNVLGQKPDISRGVVKFNDVTYKMNKNYDNGVTLAYQLGIMGINMENNNFRPNDEVTRAEFATALSRMLYGTVDGRGRIKYYEPHMAKLYYEGIISNRNPNMKELRGYVMLMLMRSTKK